MIFVSKNDFFVKSHFIGCPVPSPLRSKHFSIKNETIYDLKIVKNETLYLVHIPN